MSMQFAIEAFHNPYLSSGARRMDAVLTVTTTNSENGELSDQTGGGITIGIIVDKSGSMQGERIDAVRHAVRKVLGILRPEMRFFIVAFSGSAEFVYPLTPATPEHIQRAEGEVKKLWASGDTWMSAGLDMARSAFAQASGGINQALFLTDGKNNERDDQRLESVLAQCEGLFQCDCRGVGTDWQVKQLQRISTRLLGTSQIIADPSGIEDDFSHAINSAAQRTLGNVRLRLWTPKSVKVTSVKQMSPEIVVLTNRGTVFNEQATDYPTGAWSGTESRDYYVAVELPNSEMGEEMLALRPSIVYESNGLTHEVKNPAARVVAAWTQDEELSARIDHHVAHYTGQAELATAIQEGLEARASGDLDTATAMLGRAAKLAAASGNDETTSRLRKVVDIVDANQGTVRLKREVAKADEMDLDLGSTRTARAKRTPTNE